MSEMLPLTGEVVFNKLTTPDVFMGTSKYTLTIALDKEGKKLAEKNGLKTNDYEGKTQITSKRKIDFGQPKVYNADKEEVGINHLSLYGDTVTIKVKPGKGDWSAFTYLEAVRVEEKADGAGELDESDF